MTKLSKLANSYLSKVVPYKPGKSSEDLARETGKRKSVKLASNESAFGPSPKAIAAIQKAAHSVHRYPDSVCTDLRKELSRRLCVGEDGLIFGNGSDEIIVMAIRAFVGRTESVLTAKPTFLVYGIASKSNGVGFTEVPMKEYSYDLDAMLKSVDDKTKLIFIANPDNPNGTMKSYDELKRFISKVPKSCIVFIDEAYHEYAEGSQGYATCIDLISKGNVIVSRTFSKAYGLSGLRLGYAAADVRLIDAMNRVREPFNVNLIAQIAAKAALSDSGFLKRVQKTNFSERRRVAEALEGLGAEVVPSSANFILFRIRGAESINEQLLEQGIIIRSMSGWGLKDCLRVTISNESENTQFIEGLTQILKGSVA